MTDEIDIYWMKEPCGPCPYSRSKTLPLHPERAADFAYNAANRYNEFPCHKTADLVEDDEGSGSYVYGRKSLTCNGFLSLQCLENDIEIEGFEPHPDAFGDHWEMIEHHQMLWDDRAAEIEARKGMRPNSTPTLPDRKGVG